KWPVRPFKQRVLGSSPRRLIARRALPSGAASRVRGSGCRVRVSMGGHRDLRVWHDAMELAEAVYALTKTFPREEIYGLTSQLERAAVSVPSNIAEGYGRGGKDYERFVGL